MTTFGTYDKTSAGVEMEPGMYDGIIESATVVREQDGELKVTEYGKNLVRVAVRLDRDMILNRTMSISLGQNKANGQYAVFAKFIEAATGIKCGDKAQRNVTDEDLRGKRVRIVVEQNDKGYMDITSFMPAARAARKAAPVDSAFLDEDGNEIPF